MAISIDWPTGVITVPQADLTFVSGLLYELDVDVFRLALKALEATEEGMFFPITHTHNTFVDIGGGTVLAQVVLLVNGYTVTFEDGQYAVRLVGANANIADYVNVNQVSVRSNNSAGLIQVDTGGGGGSAPTAGQNAAAVWAYVMGGATAEDRLKRALTLPQFLALK